MKISSLYTEVADRVQDAPEELVKSACRRALSRFYMGSTCWRERVSCVPLRAGVAEYEFVDEVDHPVCAITDMRILGTQAMLEPTMESKMNLVSRTWRIDSGGQPLRYLCPREPGIAWVWPIPAQGGDFLDVELALYPGPRTAEVPDFYANLFFDALVEGACGVLYRLPRRVWSDVRAAADADAALLGATVAAKGRITKSNTTGITMARLTGFNEL
ncbi:MAG: hypothetical protein V4772_15600 [Pseudomonadota bacterium]